MAELCELIHWKENSADCELRDQDRHDLLHEHFFLSTTAHANLKDPCPTLQLVLFKYQVHLPIETRRLDVCFLATSLRKDEVEVSNSSSIMDMHFWHGESAA